MSRVFVDLETTGVDRNSCRIVEIGIIFVEDDGTETEFSSLVNPMGPIPKQASDIHGILEEHVKDAPTFKDIAQDIFNIVSVADEFVAYNFTFDFQILKNELERAGLFLSEKSFIFFDPMKIFKHYFPHKLHVAYEHYTGEVLENAHRALDDIRATKKVFDVQKLRHNDLLEMNPAIDVIGSWFIVNDEGKLVFTKGKHKGEEAKKVTDKGYFKWLSELEDLTDSERTFIKECTGKK